MGMKGVATAGAALPAHRSGLEALAEPGALPLAAAEHLGRAPGFLQSHMRAGRIGRRLAVGQVDDADLVALPDQASQGSAAGDFHIVRMRTDGNDVQLRIVAHGNSLMNG